MIAVCPREVVVGGAGSYLFCKTYFIEKKSSKKVLECSNILGWSEAFHHRQVQKVASENINSAFRRSTLLLQTDTALVAVGQKRNQAAVRLET